MGVGQASDALWYCVDIDLVTTEAFMSKHILVPANTESCIVCLNAGKNKESGRRSKFGHANNNGFNYVQIKQFDKRPDDVSTDGKRRPSWFVSSFFFSVLIGGNETMDLLVQLPIDNYCQYLV